MFNEFKKFILRGSVIDLSVGIIIGGAFTAIVNSMVNNIIMPFMGVLTAGVNFKDIKIDLSGLSKALGNVVPDEGVYLSVGLFINAVVEFLIMSFVIFFIIKLLNNFKTKKEEEPTKPTPVEKPEDTVLLEKILKELKTQKNK